ncbi:unnamed protein product, partial [Owenia fusiformis]
YVKNLKMSNLLDVISLLLTVSFCKTAWIDEPCRNSATPQCPAGYDEPPLLIVSLDGFRAEYLLRNLTPTLQRFTECGSHSKYMRAVYPTKTFVNHYSIISGLYPEDHGLIDQNMYDMEMRAQFRFTTDSKNDPRWWQGEPFWNTVMRQGKRANAMFWPGSDVEIQGMRPNVWFPYDGSFPYTERVETVLGWIDEPVGTRPDFMTLYFEEPDSSGHSVGPNEQEVLDALIIIDEMIGLIMDGLQDRGLANCINIIITADHGMGQLGCDQVVYMRDYIFMNDYYIYTGPNGRMSSRYVYRNGRIEHVPDGEGPTPNETIAQLNCVNDHMDVFKKEDFPKRHHYAKHNRIEEVLNDIDDGWFLTRYNAPLGCLGGSHGYDETFTSMHAIFLAHGPGIKSGVEIDAFDNIEVYNMMAGLLGVTPSLNNGTSGTLNQMLEQPLGILSTPSIPYATCPYPDEQEYSYRISNSDCVCEAIEGYTNKTIVELDEQLILGETEITSSQTRHAPYGQPLLVDNKGVAACVLTQRDYIHSFTQRIHMPLWSSVQVTSSMNGRPIDDDTACIRQDARLTLDGAARCAEYSDIFQDEIDRALLFTPSFLGTTDNRLDAMVSSNMVPMYRSFRDNIWRYVQSMLLQYGQRFETVQITSGPIFDYNYDGLADSPNDIERRVGDGPVPIPTHYFVISTRCAGTLDANNQCSAELKVQTFIIPHAPSISNCMANDEFLANNIARVKDVELLTGLEFFPNMNQEQAVRVRTSLPEALW